MSTTQFKPRFKDTVVVFASLQSVSIDTNVNSTTFGHLIAVYQNGDTQDFGIVTAYAEAKNAGYQGTEAQWAQDIASLKTYKTAAETAKTGAETAKTAAQTAQTAAETAKTAAQTANTAAQTAKTAAQTARTGAEAAQTAAEAARTGAETAYNALVNMTVGSTTGEPDTSATVVKSRVGNVDHLQFTIPRGTPFTIYRTYASISAMNADAANVPEGKYVMISSNIEDADNAKMYVKEASAFSFVADLSGARGDIASATTEIRYQNSSDGTTIPTGTWTSTPSPVGGTYLWTRVKLTWNDASTSNSTFYSVGFVGINGTGSVSTVQNILPDANGNVNLTPNDIGALSTTGGTVIGTVILSKNTDAEGEVYNSPALVVGGLPTQQHLEIDGNEILAKADERSGSNLSLNFNGGGAVNIAAGAIIAHPTDGVTLKTPLTVSNGGTGVTTAVDAANQFINALGLGISDPTDNDYMIAQYVGGGETNKTYYRRKMSALWNYIKSKFMPAGYVPVANGGTGATTAANARTNLGITPENIGAVPAAGGIMTGTLRIAKSTDASGTSYTGPALVVGGNPDGAHIEIDNNEIIAKENETTGATLSLNFDGGGNVNIANGAIIADPVNGVTLKRALSIENGGTGATTAAAALTALGAAPKSVMSSTSGIVEEMKSGIWLAFGYSGEFGESFIGIVDCNNSKYYTLVTTGAMGLSVSFISSGTQFKVNQNGVIKFPNVSAYKV